jgi:phosphoglycerol transferase MdoB-like AlkP superfamily enzyme
MCTGLLPMSVKNTFAKTYEDYFAFALPHVLAPKGYSATAFHNNSGTVYDRVLSHPNLGYDFYYKGNGLDVSGWPQSDLEMMQQSLPMYIDQEPFIGYYMTVSGHLNYNFSGNSQSSKHKEEVADLPYSDGCKAYIACHIELDLAMEYLLNELEAAGIADHTLIVMVADHYPYGLSDEEISEFLGHEVETTFERYKSTLVLYTPNKNDSEIVTKPCEAIDVLPTVLNMLGADYDSRLITGRDIFADEPGLVIFPSRSFITDDYSFKYSGKVVTPFTEREISEDELKTMRKQVDNAFYVSSQIASLDYYRILGLDTYYQTE